MEPQLNYTFLKANCWPVDHVCNTKDVQSLLLDELVTLVISQTCDKLMYLKFKLTYTGPPITEAHQIRCRAALEKPPKLAQPHHG